MHKNLENEKQKYYQMFYTEMHFVRQQVQTN